MSYPLHFLSKETFVTRRHHIVECFFSSTGEKIPQLHIIFPVCNATTYLAYMIIPRTDDFKPIPLDIIRINVSVLTSFA
ncbi:hypothetical protein C451_19908 [Halococcus thailandensis JCM 13552]|uniref:Uncharacterized protein n=1 Tax=Halococcus thailandensis JCM 13552 TaxID=1227457 RepID=M0MT75_9EURY|nr:hypothetical protein C451_19908 [Halococcus thailandensis JCM 13552]